MKYLGSLILSYTFATFAELSNVLDGSHGLPGDSIKSGAGEQGLSSFFSGVVKMLQDITAIVAVLGICIVGILYITSNGNEEKTEHAKKYIMAIIVGIVLAFTAWAMISLIDLIPNSINF